MLTRTLESSSTLAVDLLARDGIHEGFHEDAAKDHAVAIGPPAAAGAVVVGTALRLGVGAAAMTCAIEDPRKPVVVPFSFGDCNPGCSRSPLLRINSVGLNRLTARDLAAFREVVPYSSVAVLAEPSWIAGCDAERVAAAIAPPGTRVTFVSVEPGDPLSRGRRQPVPVLYRGGAPGYR